MSFQAYLDTIRSKTGKSSQDFKTLAKKKGYIEKGKMRDVVKATQITNWLKEEFGLGQGHARPFLRC